MLLNRVEGIGERSEGAESMGQGAWSGEKDTRYFHSVNKIEFVFIKKRCIYVSNKLFS
jgi:hypothetical protein